MNTKIENKFAISSKLSRLIEDNKITVSGKDVYCGEELYGEFLDKLDEYKPKSIANKYLIYETDRDAVKSHSTYSYKEAEVIFDKLDFDYQDLDYYLSFLLKWNKEFYILTKTNNLTSSEVVSSGRCRIINSKLPDYCWITKGLDKKKRLRTILMKGLVGAVIGFIMGILCTIGMKFA